MKERANAIMEMILVLPLALLFLFVAIDAGLALTERAAVADAFRSSLANELLAHAPSQSWDPHDNFDLAFLQSALAEIAQQVETNLRAAQKIAHNTSAPFLVHLRFLELSVDPLTGTLIGYQDTAIAKTVPINSLLAGTPDSWSSYATTKLGPQLGNISVYSIPAGAAFGLHETSQSYHPRVFLLYTQLVALPRGAHPGMVQQLIGSRFRLQKQSFVMLRAN